MFGKIFTWFYFVMILTDGYIFHMYISKFTDNILLRSLWFLPSILLLAGLIFFFYFDFGEAWRDMFSIIYMLIALPKLVFTVFSLLDFPLKYFFTWKIYPFTLLGLLLAVGVFCIVFYGGIFGKDNFKIKRVDFASPDLPSSFDGYRIVQISDMHLGSWENNRKTIRRVVSMINNEKADIILFTGDLINHRAVEIIGFENILSQLKAPDGVYSVMGNHDYGPYYDWDSKEAEIQNIKDLMQTERDMGWTLLNNTHTFITRGNDSIALIGVENSGNPPFPDYGDLPAAMKGTSKTAFKLLMSHDPTHWRREVLDTDINLMLAGHTHGTQFALGPFSFAAFVYDEWRGMYKEEDQGLYVNLGIGFVGLPFRFGAWPEITVITLKSKK
ncbi:MAG: metallophosphoesterase [Candidatus Azobacteroides sp.]|nr:metallophosphoesterase [Candidatus Azobacteroides sp.]